MTVEATTSSISTLIAQPEFIYGEDDPFERICARLGGINAISVIAATAVQDDSPPTQMVWESLWYSIGLMTEDIKRDMYQVLQENNQLVKDALARDAKDMQP